jgi:ribose-phosphate pyrophosphokinase
LTIASPDMGGSKERTYSKFLESDVVICYKQRKKANVSTMELIGEVKEKCNLSR